MESLKFNEYEIADKFGSIVFYNREKNLTVHLENSFSSVSVISSIKKLRYLGVPEELISKFVNWAQDVKDARIVKDNMETLSDFKWCRLSRFAAITRNKDILCMIADVYGEHGEIDCQKVMAGLKELGVSIPAAYHCSECPSLSFRASLRSKGVHVQ